MRQKIHLKLNSDVSFQYIMYRLLKMTHRHCCEQFHVYDIFFPPIYTRQPYHQAGGKRASIDKKLVFVTARDVNINGLLDWVVVVA